MNPAGPGLICWGPFHDHGGFPVLGGYIPDPKFLSQPVSDSRRLQVEWATGL